MAVAQIAQGHPVLVGPTTGLGGLFLGPLWYYVNLPAFIIFGGNPWGICLYLIFLSCLALPLFWFLAHRLFSEKIWAVLCALFLALIPGSIQASIFVWNPLLSVPLMTGALLSFWKARTARKWLALGFLLLGLTLQSEFAYAVFFLPVLFVSIPWIRQKLDWRDFGVAIGAVAVTGIPQFLFELRNHFIMTTSLLHSMSDTSQSVSWAELWATRPLQLLSTSRSLLLGSSYSGDIFNIFIICLVLLALYAFVAHFRSEKKKASSSFFLWQLLFLFALIPYPFYLLWRGNHGYFFDYYITPHFVFLAPIIVLGIHQIVQFGKRFQHFTVLSIVAATLCTLIFGAASLHHLDGTVFRPENNAGLGKMMTAVAQIYEWHQQDATNPALPWVVKTYTANVYTEQYDYLLGWYGKAHQISPPQTVLNGQESTWYIIIESREHAMPIFFDPWYKTATQGGHQIRQKQIGVLTLETWQK